MPEWKAEIRARLANLHFSPTRENAIVEELSQDLDDCYAALLASGASEAEAYQQTLSELSSSEIPTRELRREERQFKQEPILLGTNQRATMIADLWQDLRFGVRTLRKNPGFTLIAVLTLALGIGANTAIFSVVNALLLRPLPYRQPEQLVKVFRVQPDPAKGDLSAIWSYPRFEMLREENQSFAEVAGFNQSPYNLTGTDAPDQLQMELVSAGYFELLGVNTIVGRPFTKEDAGTAAMLGYGLWQRRYGGDPKVPVLAPLQAAKVESALKTSFLLLLAAVGLVLLIACANVTNLQLARAVARQREFALRAALGASRQRLLRQLLTESLLLALAGGALGALFARWGVTLLMRIRPSDDTQSTQFWSAYTHTFNFFTVNLDWRVLGFNFALALLTGLLFGLLPALQSSFINVNAVLKESAGFHGPRKASVRGLLVIGEMALALLLLSGAGLMLNSLWRLQSVKLGFVPENLLQMTVYARDAKPEFYEQVLARVQALPGVEAASFSRNAPLLGRSASALIDIEGRADSNQPGQASVGFHSVSPDYFKTLGIALLRGRVFTAQDRAGAPRVALINKAAAEKFFPGEDPIGQRLRPYARPQYQTNELFVEIVGVVDNVPYERLEEGIGPDIYVSALQPTGRTPILIVRSSLDPAALTAAVRQAVLALDRNVPLTAIQTMRERAVEMTSRTRFIAVVLGLFAGLALLLAGIGIYGVMAYSVSARTREVGIRMALGAQSADVIRLILGQGLMLASIGVGIGLLASLALTRLMKGLLFGVGATDPLTFSVITLLLLGVAGLACWLPARRATKVDQLVALRYE